MKVAIASIARLPRSPVATQEALMERLLSLSIQRAMVHCTHVTVAPSYRMARMYLPLATYRGR